MQNHFTVRGVPTSLAMDGWWLNCSTDTSNTDQINSKPNTSPFLNDRLLSPILGTLLLVVLADFLFWEHKLGLSLAIYALAVFGVATYNLPLKSRIRPAILLLLGVLPVVEYVQLLSLVFLSITLLVALVWAHDPHGLASKNASAAVRLFFALPVSGVQALSQTLASFRGTSPSAAPQALKGYVRNWAFPIGGSLVFLALLMDANPVFGRLLSLENLVSIRRILFWLGVGLLLWPLVDGSRYDRRGLRIPNVTLHHSVPGLNAGSVLRSLIMFNLLIGAQTVLDFSIFAGGAELPKGMTYATYAHRGAYPLVVTALLAGAFAIAARPFLGEHRLLKPLLMLWLAQNTLLCLAAGLRLDLYIEAYGLTYMRIRAMIWMGMVAIGLLLTAWQILKERSNRWLVVRCVSLAVAVLYICCFVNFAAMIATVNILNHNANPDDFCEFGPTAGPAAQEAAKIAALPEHIWDTGHCDFRQDKVDGWRDWGVRKWRTKV